MSTRPRWAARRRPAVPVTDAGPRADRTTSERVYLLLFAAVVGLFVVALLWIVVTGLVARAELDDVKGELKTLRTALTHGDVPTARRLSHRIAEQTASAHQLTSGPAWWVGSNIPALGSPLHTGRVVSLQADRIGRATTALARATDGIETSRRADTTVDVSRLAGVAAALDATRKAVQTAQSRTAAAPASWLPMVSGGRRDFLAALARNAAPLAGAARAADALVPLVDRPTPQRYFVGFMNEAEARGLGGLPGAFAVVTVARGRVAVTHFGNDPEFHHVSSGVDLGAEYRARYGPSTPADLYANSDISPDLRDAGRIWAGMWEKVSGQHVDGALMLDPSTLGYLLGAVGPATLPDGTQVTTANVVALTQRDQYAKFSSDARRNAFLTSIAEAVTARLTASVSSHLGQTARALLRAVRERRLGVWSADAPTEARLVAAGYGAVLEPSDAFTGFTVVNAAGSKLDYYLQRTMTYHRSSCAAGAIATATFELYNDAPRSGLPPYVTIRADDHPAGVRPGDNRLLVTYYASTGATVEAVFVDGERLIVATAPEHGLVAATIDLELPVQAKRTITVQIREPRATRSLTVLTQPLVRSPTTRIDRQCDPSR